MTLVVLPCQAAQRRDAGQCRRSTTFVSRLALLVAALFSTALISCLPKVWLDFKTNYSKLVQVQHTHKPNDQPIPRIVLTKRAPVPSPDMQLEKAGPSDYFEMARRKARVGDLARRWESLEVRLPSVQPHRSTMAMNEHISTSNAAEHTYIREPAIHPILSHPVVQGLDRKRKLDHLELQASDQKLKKAQAERDAILKHKPERKSQKGKRVSELTMHNIGVVKATVVKKVDEIQAKRSDKKFQQIVKAAADQSPVD